MADWSRLFVGRDAELDKLKSHYEAVSAGQTRIVALVAESGFGKTRLVQEFYNWLSTHHDGTEDAGYWPDVLLQAEDNLLINPDIAVCGKRDVAMPFLWWGLRLHDPGARNEIVTRSIWAGIDILKAHLEHYLTAAHREELKRKTRKDLVRGVADVALDAAVDALGNFLSFGLLGTGKSVLEKSKDFYDIVQESRRLDALETSPQAAFGRAQDELSATITADLARIVKSPPGTLRPIPLVLVVDDAQWIAHDDGMAAFLTHMVERARAERWPLLVVLTCWEREWQASKAVRKLPSSLADDAGEDEAVFLARNDHLGSVLRAALPGITGDQCAKLVEQIDGNPRFMDEIIQFLGRNRKYFADRDTRSSLTEAGMSVLATMDFPDFVADRFVEAPEHVRRAMGLASLHGVTFSPRLVTTMAESLNLTDISDGLVQGQDPHGFAMIDEAHGEGEFRLRAYRNAAREDLGNHVDEDQAVEALAAARATVVADAATASDRDLILIAASEVPAEALRAAAELIKRAHGRFDMRSVGAIASKMRPLLSEERGDASLPDMVSVAYSHVLAMGIRPDDRDLARDLLAWARRAAEVKPEDEAIRNAMLDAVHLSAMVVRSLEGNRAAIPFLEELVVAFRSRTDEERDALGGDHATVLVRLGSCRLDLAETAAARDCFAEAVAIVRRLATRDPTEQKRMWLSCALSTLSAVTHKLDGAAAGRQAAEEGLVIARGLMEASSPAGPGALSLALSCMATIVHELEGPLAAREYRETELAMCRVRAEETGAPPERQNLAMSLGRMGELVVQIEDHAAALPYFEEGLTLARSITGDNRNRDTRRLLGLAISRLGTTLEVAKGTAAAAALYEEGVGLARESVEFEGGWAERNDLAVVLGNYGKSVALKEGPVAALPVYREAAELFQHLVAEQVTPELQSQRSFALARLGGTIEAIDGGGAGRSYFEQSLALARSIAEVSPTPARRQDHAQALIRSGDLIEKLEGLSAARPYREEELQIARAVAEEAPIFSYRFGLLQALVRYGNMVETLDGMATARSVREEELALSRSLADERPTPATRLFVAAALARLGVIVEALDGPSVALTYREEDVAISRSLVEAGDVNARAGLAGALVDLGDTLVALGDRASARRAFEEAVELAREMVAEGPVAKTLQQLACAVDRLGGVIEFFEGPVVAEPFREEYVAVSRLLAADRSAEDGEDWLVTALAILGDTVRATKGEAAALRHYREAEHLCRARATARRTADTLQTHCWSLGRLGNCIETLEGPAASLTIRKEAALVARALVGEAGGAPQALDVAVALANLGGALEAIEGPAAAQAVRLEAVAVIQEQRSEGDSSSLTLNAVICRRYLARAALLGSDGWTTAFAQETISADAAEAVKPDIEAILHDFQAWAATAGSEQAHLRVAAASIDLARCHLALSDAAAASALCEQGVARFEAGQARHPVLIGLVRGDAWLLWARANAQLGDAERADACFSAALSAYEGQMANGVAEGYRGYAATAWFHAEHLLTRSEDARAAAMLRDGMSAARYFAERGGKDGAAILARFIERA